MSCFFRYFLCVVSTLALLSGCQMFDTHKAKPRRPAVAAQAEPYVLSVAQLKLALADTPPRADKAKSYVKSLNQYVAANKKSKKKDELTILALEYKLKGSDKETLLVPVASGAKQFDALQRITPAFMALPHTLHNIRAYSATMLPAEAVEFPKDDPSAWPQRVQAQQSALMSEAETLSVPENAQLQLDLAKFFLRQRMRDAAYLALENAKEAAATMAGKMPEQAEAAVALSKDVAATEQKLHKEMPYKF